MNFINNNWIKKYCYMNYILFAIYLILLFFISVIIPTEDVRFKTNEIESMNENWKLVQKNGESKNITLPYEATSPVGEWVQIGRKLPEAFKYGQTIRLRSSMEDMKIYLDGEIIYDNTTYMSKKVPYTPEASIWILVDIPVENNGSYFEVEVRTDIAAMSGILNSIYYGGRGDLIGQLLTSQKGSLLLVAFVLGISLFTFMISLTGHQLNTKRLTYLSILSFCMGIWILSEIDILQMFVGNSFIVGSISYLLLPVAGGVFVLFIKEAVLDKYSKLINLFAIMFSGYLVLMIVLQVLFGVHYFSTWIAFLLLTSISLISIIILLIKESIIGNHRAKKYLIIIGILIATAIIEVLLFIIRDFKNISSFLKMGIAIFLILIVLDTLHYLNRIIQKEGENNYLRNIAYKDSLTGGFNRAAFEEEVDKLLSFEIEIPFRLTMFDLNNLKKINDHYGHETGDVVLKLFHQCLSKAFEEKGKCYRVGGDEFMVIQKNITEKDYEDAISIIKEHMVIKEKEYGFQYGVAYGTDIYRYDRSFGEFKHQVDQFMYKAKKEYKLQMKELDV